MKINLVETSIEKNGPEIEIIFVKSIENLNDKEILENLEFKAKDEACVLLAESKKIYVGYEEENYDSIAIASATAIKKLQTTKFKSAKIQLNEVLENNFKALVEGALLGEYKFTNYKSEKDNKKIHFNISFTTNGLLINEEFINFFLNNKLNVGLQITFDGYKEEHDEVRYVSKTRGSYSNIVENIKKILSYDNFFVQARINYTDKNICNAFKIVDDFTDISEYAKKNQLVFDFHRVWQNSKLDDVSEILLESCEKMKEKGFRTHIQYTPNNVKDSCYADKRNSATINYNGDIFKCTARDFSQENRSGYLTQEGDLVWENDSLEKRMNAKFRNRPCLSCKILPLCNGGCTQHAVEHYEIDDDYCVYYGDESEKNKIIYAKIEEILHV